MFCEVAGIPDELGPRKARLGSLISLGCAKRPNWEIPSRCFFVKGHKVVDPHGCFAMFVLGGDEKGNSKHWAKIPRPYVIYFSNMAQEDWLGPLFFLQSPAAQLCAYPLKMINQPTRVPVVYRSGGATMTPITLPIGLSMLWQGFHLHSTKRNYPPVHQTWKRTPQH